MPTDGKAHLTIKVDRAKKALEIAGNDFWSLHGTLEPFVTEGYLQGLSVIDQISIKTDGTMHFAIKPDVNLQDAIAQSLAYAARIHGMSLINDDISIKVNINEPPRSTIIEQARQIEAEQYGRHNKVS